MRIPENISIYDSILEMSICRGDMSSAKLALRYYQSREIDDSHLKYLLSRIVLTHFSFLTEEVHCVNYTTAWKIISGLCVTPLNYSALTLSILQIYGYDSPLLDEIKTWSFLQYKKKFVTPFKSKLASHLFIITCFLESNYLFSPFIKKEYITAGRSADTVSCATTIHPDYYLGESTWLRPHIVESIKSLLNWDSTSINNFITFYELYSNNRDTSMNQILWEEVISCVFGSKDIYKKMEHLWESQLKANVMDLITSILQLRLPIPENGLNK